MLYVIFKCFLPLAREQSALAAINLIVFMHWELASHLARRRKKSHRKRWLNDAQKALAPKEGGELLAASCAVVRNSIRFRSKSMQTVQGCQGRGGRCQWCRSVWLVRVSLRLG